MATLSLFSLIDQHPILVTLASYLSTLDLLHLSLASRHSHALIGSSAHFFDVLKRQCLCDGRGLVARLSRHRQGGEYGSWWEEEEVRLFRRKCDEANALPCRLCGINVCDACRSCPRTVPNAQRLAYAVRPHLNLSHELGDVMCLCPKCDDATEDQLRGQFLNALCDCDPYRRWVCRKCRGAELREAYDYIDKHTMQEHGIDGLVFEELQDRTKVLFDHGFPVLFFCTCGSTVPAETRPRCLYCKRRHRPEEQWDDEARELNGTMPPYIDDGGCLPSYSSKLYPEGTAWHGYPPLGYQGPIYRSTDEADGRVSEGSGQTTATTLILRSTQKVQGAHRPTYW